MRWLGMLVLLVASTAHAELSREQVRKTMKAHIREIAACFDTEPPPPDQRVVVAFTIAPSGQVIESVGTGNPPVDDCAAAVIKKVKFPASNSATHVVYPFWLDATR
ncbi:MAG TPA: AgmX/PglI C-terminal domain-containing protein [Kofleriaceae bacterium]